MRTKHSQLVISILALVSMLSAGTARADWSETRDTWNLCSNNSSDNWFLHVKPVDKDHAQIDLCTVPQFESRSLGFEAGRIDGTYCKPFATLDLKEFRRAKAIEQLKGSGIAVGDAAIIVAGIAAAIYGGVEVYGVVMDGAAATTAALGVGAIGRFLIYGAFGTVGVSAGFKVAGTIWSAAKHVENFAEKKLNPMVYDDRATEFGAFVPHHHRMALGCDTTINPADLKKTALRGLADATARIKAESSVVQDSTAPKQVAAPQAPSPTAAPTPGSQTGAS